MRLIFLGVITASVLMVQSAMGEDRVLSIYLESIAAMQGQLFQAAQVFDMPELGSAPMMFNMMVPGYAQVDRDAPIGFHVYADKTGAYSLVIDLLPRGTPEALLGTLLAAQGVSLPEPVDGRYEADQGVAQVHGDRVVMAQDSDMLDMALRVGIPADIPAVPGMLLRIQMNPRQLVHLIDHAETMMDELVPDKNEHADMLAQLTQLYRKGLVQISSYEMGIGVREDGLALRSSIKPVEGRALASIIQSLQTVHPAWVSSLEQDNILGIVSGSYEVPEHVLQSLVAYYVKWMESMQPEDAMDAELLRAMFEPTMKTVGGASFLFIGPPGDVVLNVASGTLVADSDQVVEQMVELAESDAYRKSMAESGMKMAPVEMREVEGASVYRWSIELDDEQFLENMKNADGTEIEKDHWEIIKPMIENIFSGYDYAATPEGIVFSMSDEAGLTGAIELLRESGRENMTAPVAILEKMDAPVMPYTMGRFDLILLLRSMRNLGLHQLPLISTEGEGILFAGWQQEDHVEQLLLIPASDVRVIRQAIATMTP